MKRSALTVAFVVVAGLSACKPVKPPDLSRDPTEEQPASAPQPARPRPPRPPPPPPAPTPEQFPAPPLVNGEAPTL